MFWNKDALGYEVVVFLGEGGAVSELFYAVEAVGGHLIRGYEYGLCLALAPLIETLIVEAFCLAISVCALVRNITIYHAVFWDADLFVVKHRGSDW